MERDEDGHRGVGCFLGSVGYYKRFIRDFSIIATPLMGLMKKDKKFMWDAKCENGFKF